MLIGKQLGKFAVDKEIGAGAMGTVYKARYTPTGKEVAIKIISAGLDTHSTTLARFEREAEILKPVDPPNIVRLFATGRYCETPFYVMEYIQGETLEHLLERRGRFTWEEVVTLGQQISAALQHAPPRHRCASARRFPVALTGHILAPRASAAAITAAGNRSAQTRCGEAACRD